ncbi:MAG: ATP-binding protein [Thermoanaerobaculia bacterium]|nr:ATP-binding protein [Thermoanaerobaculia bacterium]
MQQITLTLPMIPDMELTASKTAGAMGEHIGMSRDKIDEVQMAVVEACINAFEHSGAREREVQMKLSVFGSDEANPEGLQILIRDSGVGFDPDPTQKLQPMQKRGHGLRIIHGLMDEVHIESDGKGTTVLMKKLR